MSLSTHVLDNVAGLPAEGMKVELWKMEADHSTTLVRDVVTNADGRVDEALLNEKESNIGEYELVFYVADFYQKKGTKLADPPFLNQVPIRFSIAEPNSHYHVPLLITPWSYSTYRGS